jgi:hypothetical protein
VLYPVARFLHFASVIICLIVVASFALFVVNQTNDASAHQQEVLNGGLPPGARSSRAATPQGSGGPGSGSTTSDTHKSAIREALDEASSTLTSPFSEAFADSSSEWAKRGARLLLALVVYGFGLGYLARMIRVRA